MLAIWSLVSLPFLNPAWTSGSLWFTYSWSLAWRILSINLLACVAAAAAKSLQSCPSLCDPMDCSLRGFSIHAFSRQEHWIYFCLIDHAKAFAVWITTNCGKFFRRWEYQTAWPASWEICVQVKKQQLEVNMERRTGSKLGKGYIKAVYCHPAYLTYM